MKRSTMVALGLVFAVGSLGYAYAQRVGGFGHSGSGHVMPMYAGGMMGSGQGGMMSGNGDGMMGQGGMHQGNGQMQRQNQTQPGNTPAIPRNMQMRGMMMYNLQANPEAPAGVLALQKQLQLTPEQVQKIQQIAQQARQQTQQVLTARQQQTLKQLNNTPNTYMGMHNQMLKWMMQHMQGQMMGRGGHMMGGQGMMHGHGMMNGRMMGRGNMMGQGIHGAPWMNMMQWQFGSPNAQSNVSSKQAGSTQPNKTFTLSTGLQNGKLAYIGAGQATKGQDNPTLHVKKGDLIKIVLNNGDGVVHDIVIPAFKASSANVTTKGSQTTLVFRADRVGTFPYYCSIPGHRDLGMQGKIVVSE